MRVFFDDNETSPKIITLYLDIFTRQSLLNLKILKEKRVHAENRGVEVIFKLEPREA